MGYMHYLYAVEKTRIEEVSKMSEAQVKKAQDRDDGIREIIGGKRVHEFGEIRTSLYDAVHGFGVPLFLDQDAAEYFSDYNAIVTGQEGLTALIEGHRQIVLENLEKDLAGTLLSAHLAGIFSQLPLS